MSNPVHRWIARHIQPRNLAAFAAVLFVVVVLIVPSFFLVERAVHEGVDGVRQLQVFFASDRWHSLTSSEGKLGRAAAWLDENMDVGNSLQAVAGAASKGATRVVVASIRSIVLLVIMLFTLFYFFRDHQKIVSGMISLLPLPDAEIERLVSVTADAIHATIYGRFTIAAVQGALGGLMFGLLGIHAPLLWALLMMLFSLVPMLGAFIIWVPAAIVLAIQGSWVKGVVLTIWGAFVIGLIDNLLYPLVVGNRLQMHSLLIFFAALGGIAAFGASGIVVGPVILSVGAGVLQLWRRRLAGTPTVEEPGWNESQSQKRDG